MWSDPFYRVLEFGVQAAGKDLGVEIVVSPYPATWGATAQTPYLDALVARGDLRLRHHGAGELDRDGRTASGGQRGRHSTIVGVDTYLGDGDYVNGPVTFPLTYIGTDNYQGGYTVGTAMAEALGGRARSTSRTPTPSELGLGSEQGLPCGDRGNAGMEVVDEQFSLDNEATATQQTAAVLEKYPTWPASSGSMSSAQGRRDGGRQCRPAGRRAGRGL